MRFYFKRKQIEVWNMVATLGTVEKAQFLIKGGSSDPLTMISTEGLWYK